MNKSVHEAKEVLEFIKSIPPMIQKLQEELDGQVSSISFECKDTIFDVNAINLTITKNGEEIGPPNDGTYPFLQNAIEKIFENRSPRIFITIDVTGKQ